MQINTVSDWRKLAEETILKLGDYAAENNVSFDTYAATRCLNQVGGNKCLAGMFENLWADLPDSPRMRYQPFFDLCDLCSESWVLYE